MSAFKKQFCIILGFSMLLWNNGLAQSVLNYKTIKGGILYSRIVKGKGVSCMPHHELTLRYSMSFLNEPVFDQSETQFNFILGEGEGLKGWDIALSYLHLGDSAQFIIPDSLAYQGKRMGSLNTKRPLVLNVKVVDQKKVYFNVQSKDSLEICKGIKKIILKKGNRRVHPYHYLSFNITGYIKTPEGYRRRFIQGHNTELGLQVQAGTGQYIKALDDALLTMSVGEQAHVIIEPYMGLKNSKKIMGIPPDSRLFFDIEMLNETDPFALFNFKDTLVHSNGLTIIGPSIKLSDTSFIELENKEELIYAEGYFVKFDSLDHKHITANTYLTHKPFVFRKHARIFHPMIVSGFNKLHSLKEAILTYDSIPIANGIQKQGLFLKNIQFTPFPFYDEHSGFLFTQEDIVCRTIKPGLPDYKASLNDTLTIIFTGYYKDVTGNRRIFDSSIDLQRGFVFVLNDKNIIPGLAKGICGMQYGEKRMIQVPYKFAYGSDGLPHRGIPAKTDLIFDVELIQTSKTTP